LETSNNIYWLAISAEVGHRITNPGAAWVELVSTNRATNHFWGWHTSPTNWNDASVMGRLTMTNNDWLYGQWMANDLYHMERDQAFELLTTCLTLVCPANFTLWTCGNSVPAPDFIGRVTVIDACDSVVTNFCKPEPGMPMPVGANPVTCYARDSRGHAADCTFIVTVVQDTNPPSLICPADIRAFTCNENASVSYLVTATDDCDSNVVVRCSFPPDFLFPFGTTPVTCSAMDACGNTTNCTFSVTVTNYEAIKWSQPPGFLAFTNSGDNPNLRGTNRPSDFDWRTLMETPGQPPDWVIADEFVSDGRP